MRKVLLRIKNLSKSFVGKNILDGVTFDFYEGETLGILGLSGSGKTTLLNIICGLLRPDEGKIYYRIENKEEGREVFIDYFGNKIKNIIGFSTQEPSFYPDLTIRENLEYFGEMYDIERDDLYDNIKEILTILDLMEDKNSLAKNLSEGMQKRLNIACALVHKPKVLILDEPTANLDFKLRAEFLRYIKKINSLGVSIMFISHYIEEIQEISTRILIIHNSKIRVIPNTTEAENLFMRLVKNE